MTDTQDCPKCGEGCYRDEVDVGVGVIYGPWGCPGCGWSDDPRYDSSAGPSPAQRESPGRYVDQFGGSTPVSAIADHAERFGVPRELVEEAFRVDPEPGESLPTTDRGRQVPETLFFHDQPADPDAVVERLRRVDGTRVDCAVLTREHCQAVVAEVDRLRAALAAAGRAASCT